MQRKLLCFTIWGPGRRMHSFWLLHLIFWYGVIPCLAQVPQTRVNIQLLGPEQGLPSRNTRCLAQDGRGFMWVGTGQDLWRYDGYTFQNFTGILTRSIGGSTLINQIRTGPEGSIWVAHNAGISIINPDNLTCTTINPSRHLKGADSKQHLDIFFDKKQNAWVAIPGGKLVRINRKLVADAIYTPNSGLEHRFSVESVVTNLFCDAGNHVYAYIEGNFLHEVNEKSKSSSRIDLLGDLAARHLQVASVLQSGPDRVSIYYNQQGSKKGRMRKYFFEKQTFGPLSDADTPVNPDHIDADKKGYAWYKNEKEVGFLNQKTNEFTSLTSQLQQKTGTQIFFLQIT
ncbi:two-component regulator propeller domain-containing protein [Dyadobacter sp. NIV53]|uniref:ligand-binding sensor domain-containing protein n=1 Tax=Dyadobacter sp. NIV53 TaxID=2861765 RepID=UPI001C86B248|nr:two-component regulator propeller domain-containing protein [Dyadobacter sp. NIV53]